MRVYNDAEGMEHIYYIHEDNLGSIQAVTDENRNVVSRYYYTPWGGRELLAGRNITDRGYTFHEHLEPFGLINMNGRVYDPVLARFLSPDPYVQAPGFTQSLNRYSYCLNNPFKFTDPDGEFWEFVVAAAIGGVINLASQMISGNVYDVGDAFKAFGVGALAGLAGAGAGAGVTSAMQIGGFAAGAAIGGAGGAAGGLVSGAGNAWINGASFGEGLVAGVKSAGIGALSGAVLGGVTKGLDAVVNGKASFWDGSIYYQYNNGDVIATIGDIDPELLNEKLFYYRGKIEEVRVFESKYIPDGYAATLPKLGIFTYDGCWNKWDWQTLYHEYGHILQYKEVGAKGYLTIAKESLESAKSKIVGHIHQNTWTEYWANYKAYNYFSQKGDKYIQLWDYKNFPVRNISPKLYIEKFGKELFKKNINNWSGIFDIKIPLNYL